MAEVKRQLKLVLATRPTDGSFLKTLRVSTTSRTPGSPRPVPRKTVIPSAQIARIELGEQQALSQGDDALLSWIENGQTSLIDRFPVCGQPFSQI